MYGTLNKNIKVIDVLYDNKISLVKVKNKVNSWFRIESGINQGSVLFSFIWIVLKEFFLMFTKKAMEEHGMNY